MQEVGEGIGIVIGRATGTGDRIDRSCSHIVLRRKANKFTATLRAHGEKSKRHQSVRYSILLRGLLPKSVRHLLKCA